ncbi:MAG: acyl-CoA dehydrogenase [Desulfobacterium sp.]|nr:acyl-CoA dehydrogenase [Desulfobacteraceae bacterium]MBA3036880.1 acyl-CoA dehydrogenase [Desulfobacterium sp.]MBU4035645.1 acyl-CoA/acyl-ACP dehydrogenase [Pseudomonadota bacterium]
MDFAFTQEQELIQKEVRNFCKKELTPEYVRWMDENCDFVPDELWDKICDLGFFAASIPEEYGGEGLDLVTSMCMTEEIATASVAVALGMGASNLGASVIHNLGTEQEKKEYLPKLAKGKLKFALGLTEPGGGTDILGAIQTTAVDKGDHWLINGQKVFITAAHVADYITTVAITDPNASRHNGLSVFLVPRDSQGLSTRLIPKVGCHAAGTNEVFYDNVMVPKDKLIGTLNNGWNELLMSLNNERIGTAMLSLGIAKAAFQEASEYAKQRHAFGGPIARFQILQHYLADIAIEIENARNLIYKCAWLSDSKKPFQVEACMAKVVAARASEKAAIWGMEILGGYGYTMEYDMQRHFRDYKQMVFSPISDEMAKNMIMQFKGFPKSWA